MKGVAYTEVLKVLWVDRIVLPIVDLLNTFSVFTLSLATEFNGAFLLKNSELVI